MLSALSILSLLDVLGPPAGGSALGSMFIGSGFFFYVIAAYSFMKIAKRTQFADDAIFAWIPFLNLILMLKIAGRPLWWIILFFVPVLNFFIWIFVWLHIARTLRKGVGLGLLAACLPIVGIPVLAFSSR